MEEIKRERFHSETGMLVAVHFILEIEGVLKSEFVNIMSVELARAREELRQAELELPEAFAAWPGELVELNLAKGTGRGLWRVRESVCGLKAAGTYTRLTLGEP